MTAQPQAITLPSIKLELRDGSIRLTPNKPHPGSAVIVDAKKLERWAAKLYRDGVLK